jgi:hypothetical protein
VFDDPSMSWTNIDDGKTLGLAGSEGGTIIRDEEHSEGARITIERGGNIAPYSITCGIYGWMVHTRFFGSEEEAQMEFSKMRAALGEIIKILSDSADDDLAMKVGEDAISKFVELFP